MNADVDPVTFARVLAYLVTHRPTILHTHLVHADAYGQTAGTIAGVPIRLSTKHGFNEFREGRVFALGDRTIGALAHRPDRDLARARPLPVRDRGLPRAGLRDRPLRDRRRRRAERRTPATTPRFLCIGRLIPIKGHVVLLRAFRAGARRRPDATLDIAGRGVLEHGLKDLARELGLAEAVRFLGHVTPIQGAVEESRASSCRRSARASAWSRSRRWSARGP